MSERVCTDFMASRELPNMCFFQTKPIPACSANIKSSRGSVFLEKIRDSSIERMAVVPGGGEEHEC